MPVRIRQGNLMPGPTNVKLAGQAVLLASDRAASPAPDGNPIGMDVYATFLTPEAFEAFGASAGERTGLAQAAGGAPVFGPPDQRGIERRTLRLTPGRSHSRCPCQRDRPPPGAGCAHRA